MKLELQTIEYDGYQYPITSLIQGSKNFKVLELEVAYMFMNDSITPDGSLFEFAKHMKLVMNADLKFPIILSPLNTLLDGRHRLAKAIFLDKKTIKAVKFNEMPDMGFKI